MKCARLRIGELNGRLLLTFWPLPASVVGHGPIDSFDVQLRLAELKHVLPGNRDLAKNDCASRIWLRRRSMSVISITCMRPLPIRFPIWISGKQALSKTRLNL